MLKYTTSEQFSKYANLFFLFTACIQQIPGVSPTNRYTTIAPLAVVLLASAFKEVSEDMVRRNEQIQLTRMLILDRTDTDPTLSSMRAKRRF